jgi:hypothetical protein
VCEEREEEREGEGGKGEERREWYRKSLKFNPKPFFLRVSWLALC